MAAMPKGPAAIGAVRPLSGDLGDLGDDDDYTDDNGDDNCDGEGSGGGRLHGAGPPIRPGMARVGDNPRSASGRAVLAASSRSETEALLSLNQDLEKQLAQLTRKQRTRRIVSTSSSSSSSLGSRSRSDGRTRANSLPTRAAAGLLRRDSNTSSPSPSPSSSSSLEPAARGPSGRTDGPPSAETGCPSTQADALGAVSRRFSHKVRQLLAGRDSAAPANLPVAAPAPAAFAVPDPADAAPPMHDSPRKGTSFPPTRATRPRVPKLARSASLPTNPVACWSIEVPANLTAEPLVVSRSSSSEPAGPDGNSTPTNSPPVTPPTARSTTELSASSAGSPARDMAAEEHRRPRMRHPPYDSPHDPPQPDDLYATATTVQLDTVALPVTRPIVLPPPKQFQDRDRPVSYLEAISGGGGGGSLQMYTGDRTPKVTKAAPRTVTRPPAARPHAILVTMAEEEEEEEEAEEEVDVHSTATAGSEQSEQHEHCQHAAPLFGVDPHHTDDPKCQPNSSTASDEMGPAAIEALAEGWSVHTARFDVSRGLGFQIFTEDEVMDDGVFFGEIDPRGPVGAEGSIREGDRFLYVNGEDVSRGGHDRVTGLLLDIAGGEAAVDGSTGGLLSVTVARHRTGSSTTSTPLLGDGGSGIAAVLVAGDGAASDTSVIDDVMEAADIGVAALATAATEAACETLDLDAMRRASEAHDSSIPSAAIAANGAALFAMPAAPALPPAADTNSNRNTAELSQMVVDAEKLVAEFAAQKACENTKKMEWFFGREAECVKKTVSRVARQRSRSLTLGRRNGKGQDKGSMMSRLRSLQRNDESSGSDAASHAEAMAAAAAAAATAATAAVAAAAAGGRSAGAATPAAGIVTASSLQDRRSGPELRLKRLAVAPPLAIPPPLPLPLPLPLPPSPVSHPPPQVRPVADSPASLEQLLNVVAAFDTEAALIQHRRVRPTPSSNPASPNYTHRFSYAAKLTDKSLWDQLAHSSGTDSIGTV